MSHQRLPQYSVDLEIEWKEKSFSYKGRLVVFYRKDPRNKKLYTYLHTNLNRNIFSMEEIGNLYRFRWQVELLFLEWKSYANLHRFDTGKEAISEGLIWASILAAVIKRFITHAAELSRGIELSTRRASASAQHYLIDIIKAVLSYSVDKIVYALQEAFDFLIVNARRAHPKRDREKGRLKAGLQPIATG